MEPKWKRLAKKLQSGAVLNTWQKAYDSNFGKGLRSILFGNDNELSNKEYLQKHGYAKPITGTVHLPMVPEEGPFMGVKYLTKGSFGTGARYNAGLERELTEAAAKKSLKAYESMQKPLSVWEKFIQKPIEEQNRIVKFWNGEKYSGMVDLQRSEKGLATFKKWLEKIKHKNGGILKAQSGIRFTNDLLVPNSQGVSFTPYYTPDKPIEFIQEIPESYTPQYNFDSKEESFVAAPLPEVTKDVVDNDFSEEEMSVLLNDGTTKQKQQVANKYLRQNLGLTKEQAAAIVGTWSQESGFNLNAENKEEKAGKNTSVKSNEYGIGIGQWTGNRHNNYVNYIQSHGGKNNLKTQLDFAIDEITNKYSDYLNNLKSAQSVRDATAYTYAQYVAGNYTRIKSVDDLYKLVDKLQNKYAKKHMDMYGHTSGGFERRYKAAQDSLTE